MTTSDRRGSTPLGSARTRINPIELHMNDSNTTWFETEAQRC